MALFQQSKYADLVATLREITSSFPELAARHKGGGPVQDLINQAGLDVLCYEASNGIFEGRELLAQRAALQAKLERVLDIEASFKAEEAGAEMLLIIDIRDGNVGEEEIATETAKIEARARCLRVIGAARADLEGSIADLDKKFAKLPAEAQKVARLPDEITPGERQTFQALFEAQGDALFGKKPKLQKEVAV